MNSVNQYRFSLDTSRPTRKYKCVSCGHKELRRYRDNLSGKLLPEEVGICNRLNNCAYHYSPKDFFKDNPKEKDHYFGTEKTLEIGNRLYRAFPASNIEESLESGFSSIPLITVNRSLSQYENNSFVQYLTSLFGEALATKLVNQFHIGTSKHWNGAVVFWQTDTLGNHRTGKVMLYNSETGKRIHGYDNWAHSILKIPNFKLEQCYFGEHQLINAPKDAIIALVESQKTAILMSVLFPQYVWLATCGANLLSVERFKNLKYRNVILYPDIGCFELWDNKAKELNQAGFNVIVSDFLENPTSNPFKQDKLDVADYLIYRDSHFGWALTSKQNGYPIFWNY